jgi:hypothetical protein
MCHGAGDKKECVVVGYGSGSAIKVVVESANIGRVRKNVLGVEEVVAESVVCAGALRPGAGSHPDALE